MFAKFGIHGILISNQRENSSLLMLLKMFINMLYNNLIKIVSVIITNFLQNTTIFVISFYTMLLKMTRIFFNFSIILALTEIVILNLIVYNFVTNRKLMKLLKVLKKNLILKYHFFKKKINFF